MLSSLTLPKGMSEDLSRGIVSGSQIFLLFFGGDMRRWRNR
nr:MAG TPA: hypothetical protein [Bacteriophage sp.]